MSQRHSAAGDWRRACQAGMGELLGFASAIRVSVRRDHLQTCHTPPRRDPPWLHCGWWIRSAPRAASFFLPLPQSLPRAHPWRRTESPAGATPAGMPTARGRRFRTGEWCTAFACGTRATGPSVGRRRSRGAFESGCTTLLSGSEPCHLSLRGLLCGRPSLRFRPCQSSHQSRSRFLSWRLLPQGPLPRRLQQLPEQVAAAARSRTLTVPLPPLRAILTSPARS